MRFSAFIDLIQRRINSVLFRFTLIAYALLIVFIEKNEFPKYVYWLVAVVYFAFYIFLLQKSLSRLLNDFWFITFFLLGKNPNDPFNYIFLILPVINAINFTGNQPSFWLYLFSILSYYLTAIFFKLHHDYSFILTRVHFIGAFLFLYIINKYTEVRVKTIKFRQNLIDVVDSYYTVKENIKKSREIYREIIDSIYANQSRIRVQSIYCFNIIKEEKEHLILVNGTSFIWKFSFTKEDFIKRVKEQKVLYDEPLEIEDINKPFNLVLHSGLEDYIFVFITKKRIPIYFRIVALHRIIEPVILKISKILLSELRLEQVRSEELRKLAESSQYVSRANKIMHFIRNRLGPPNNLVAQIEKMDSVPPEQHETFMKLLKAEKERTKIELGGILDKANEMLEKGNNPFDFRKTENISVVKVYLNLNRMFKYYFPDLNIELINLKQASYKFVELNDLGFEFFLTDWLHNMKKYMRNQVSCDLVYKENELVIILRNDHNLRSDDAKKMITDLMGIDRNEIMRRTTHGLFNIKNTLDEMGVIYNIENEPGKNELTFTLQLKIVK